MRVSFATRFLPVALLGVIGCPAPDTRLDDVLKKYVQQRGAEAKAACECYQLFLDFDSPDQSMFISKEACLESLLPPPEDDAIKCMRSFLEEIGSSEEESIDIVNCYTEDIAQTTDCYVQHGEECSQFQSECLSDIAKPDECKGRLTSDQVRALSYCASP